MNEFALLFGVLAFWIVLNRWVLPWFGVPTCMSGGCAVAYRPCCGPGARADGHEDVVATEGDQP
jgi:hypothetical protein